MALTTSKTIFNNNASTYQGFYYSFNEFEKKVNNWLVFVLLAFIKKSKQVRLQKGASSDFVNIVFYLGACLRTILANNFGKNLFK